MRGEATATATVHFKGHAACSGAPATAARAS